MIRGPWLLRIGVLSGASIRAVRPTRRGDHTVHLKRIVPNGDARGMRTCPKCKTPTLAPLAEDRAELRDVVPPSRCTHCQGVWLPHEAIEQHLVPASVDTERAALVADGLAGFCPRCKGQDPAKLFAKAVNDLHAHVVDERKMEMLIWGDRLLDSKALGYSLWEAATNGTPPAVDLIRKDIIVCDWHYGKSPSYASVPFLLDKGFRVWPSGWQPLEATEAFSAFSRQQKNPRLIGYLCTTWGKVKVPDLAEWPPITEVLPKWR